MNFRGLNFWGILPNLLALRSALHMRRIDLTSKRFGYLTVLERSGFTRDKKRRKKAARWLCKCSCGNLLIVRGDHLRDGKVKACAKNGHRFRPKSGDAPRPLTPARV